MRRRQRPVRIDAEERVVAVRDSGDDLERLIESIGSESEKIASEAAADSRRAGKIRAEIEAAGLRDGDQVRAPMSGDSEDGVPLVTADLIRASAEGRIEQLGARSSLRLADVQRRIEERLLTLRHAVSTGDQDLAMAQRALEDASAAREAQRELPDISKSQSVESDYLRMRDFYESTLAARRAALSEHQALEARAAAARKLRDDLPDLIAASTNDLKDSSEGAFKQGYMERLVELRNEELNPPPAEAASKPWHRTRGAIVACATCLVLAAGAAGAVIASETDLLGGTSSASGLNSTDMVGASKQNTGETNQANPGSSTTPGGGSTGK